MATSINSGQDRSYPASADLSTKQYYFVKLDSNGQLAVCGAGEAAIGVLMDKPAAAGRAGRVRRFGACPVVAGAAIAKGALVASDGSGKAKTAVKAYTNTSDAGVAQDALVGSYVMGIASEAAGADGNVITVELQLIGAAPTTAA